jgi:hypothetical protein
VPNLAGGFFVALTKIIEVFKLVNGKVFRMIILMDKGTRLRNSTMLLQSIMDQVIDFPVFLDFVRVNTEEIPVEDMELIKFANKNKGTVYFAKQKSDIPKILTGLLKKKEIHAKSDKLIIPNEKIPFFDNLGADLWVLEEDEESAMCQICRSNTGTRVKCPQCQTVAHPECLAMWAKTAHIGLPHLFRCMNCYLLLRLPPDFVADVQSGEYHKRIHIEQVNQAQLLREKEQLKNPELIHTANSFPNENEGLDAEDEEFRLERDDSKLQIQFCECGALNLPEALKCNQCGRKL